MNEPNPIRGWTLGEPPEWMRWPREGESMGAYAEYMAGYLQRRGKVVPVPDEQAIERAAKYLCTVSFSSLLDCGGDRKDIARAVLAAALEPPE